MPYNDLPNDFLSDIFAYIEKGSYGQKWMLQVSLNSLVASTPSSSLCYIPRWTTKSRVSLLNYLRIILESPNIGKAC